MNMAGTKPIETACIGESLLFLKRYCVIKIPIQAHLSGVCLGWLMVADSSLLSLNQCGVVHILQDVRRVILEAICFFGLFIGTLRFCVPTLRTYKYFLQQQATASL